MPESKAKLVAATALCAAIYAVTSYATSYIESPWGIGQFRPAVIVPAVFAILFGPWVGGVGAAVGTFIQSIARYGHPWLTLVSGTPANFFGFYLMGRLLKGRFTWARFLTVSVVVLLSANLLCAFGVLAFFVFTRMFSASLPLSFYLGFSTGLTLWWYITMLPFVLVAVPPILRAVAKSAPHIVPEDVLKAVNSPVPSGLFTKTLIASGVSMIAVGLCTLIPGAEWLAVAYRTPDLVLSGIRLMFLITGGGCTAVGVAVGAASRA